MQRLKINLHGVGWRLKKLDLSFDDFEKLKAKALHLKLPFNEAIFDSELFEDELISGIYNYEGLSGETQSGLMDFKSQLEIWFAGKKILKFTMNDLFPENLLFPLYKLQTETFDFTALKPGIYIEQEEIGLIASYNELVNDFHINDLTFDVCELNKTEKKSRILQGIKLCGKALAINRMDSLITRQHCFEVGF